MPPLRKVEQKASSDVRKRQRSYCQRLPHLSPNPTCGAGISTWHSAGLGRIGCYGVAGPDPSAVLDKFKQFSNYLHLIISNKCISMLLFLRIYTTM
jgi:hypothetical protein